VRLKKFPGSMLPIAGGLSHALVNKLNLNFTQLALADLVHFIRKSAEY
jgi:hypothetical protein